MIPVITFFNNKGSVGKTSLVYHIAWMMADRGLHVVAADLDPQGNLSAAFLDDDRLEELLSENHVAATIHAAIQPLRRGVGDVADPHVERIDECLSLIVGDMALSGFEDDLSQAWPKCLDGEERAFRVVSAFWRVLQRGAELGEAGILLVDVGPNLGAISRAALIASDHVVIPLAPDLFSLQGLRNLGPTLREWRRGWGDRLQKRSSTVDLELPKGEMKPAGYVVMQHSVRRDRPVKSYEKWMARIPGAYREHVLDVRADPTATVPTDVHCLAQLKHYRSLMPMGQEARKPVFKLKPADGALGAHAAAVQGAYEDFHTLAGRIAEKAGLSLPGS